MKVPIPRCPRMGCGHLMVRAYIRPGEKKRQYVPHHWVCPACLMTV